MFRPLPLLFLIIFLFSWPAIYAQMPAPRVWDKNMGGSMDDYFYDIAQTSDGGFIMGGYTYSGISGDKSEASRGDTDYWVTRISASGTKLWEKTIGGSADDNLSVVKQTPDGGFILGGSSQSDISGDKTTPRRWYFDYWIVKLDANGNKLWDKTYGTIQADEALFDLQITSDGGFIIGGASNSNIEGDKTQNSKGTTDFWILKLDSNGNKIWDRTIGGNNADVLASLQQTSDGGYIVGGSSESAFGGDKSQPSKGTKDYWIVKLNANGNRVWDKTFGTNFPENLKTVRQTHDGGYILGGHTGADINGDKTAPSKGGIDFWIVKVDANGNKLWDKSIGTSGTEWFGSVELTADDGFILAGEVAYPIDGDKTDTRKGGQDYWLVKLDSKGNKLWDRTIGGNSIDICFRGLQTLDGGYAVAGHSKSPISADKYEGNQGGYDFWMVKLGPSCIDLKANLSSTCNASGAVVTTNIEGRQPLTAGSPYWTLTYLVDGISQTITGTTSTAVLSPNAAFGTRFSLVSIASGSCTTNLNDTLTIQPIPAAPAAASVSRCGIGSITLSAQGAPIGGTYNWYTTSTGGTPVYSGPSGNFTTPSLNTTTDYYVAAANNGKCEGPRTLVTATVNYLVPVAGSSQSICALASPIQLTGFSPAGGTWSGPGVSPAGVFTPSSSLLGYQTLTYTVTQNNCSFSATKSVFVSAPPTVNAGSNSTICATAASIQLTGFSPAGGVWSGPGVSNTGLFSPSTALIGNQTLTYTFTQNGCSSSSTKTVTVTSPPVIQPGPNITMCANGGSTQLNGFSPTGGTWSGPGVSASGLFIPNNSLIGNQTLTYSFTQNGCSSSASRQVEVYASPAQPVINLIAPDTLISSVVGSTYEWKLNGTTLPNTTRKLKASTNGQYSVQVKNSNNCISAFSGAYSFVISGIAEHLSLSKIQLYPNPSTGIVNLVLKERQAAQVTVLNSIGQVVLNKAVATDDNNETVQLNLAAVAKGIYHVQVRTENQVIVKKIVVE